MYLSGIAADYLDYGGHHITVPWEDRLQVLQLMGFDIDSPEAVEAEVFRLDPGTWLRWLKPVHIARLQSPALEFRCHPDELAQVLTYRITSEHGEVISGTVIPGQCPEAGEYYLEGVRYSARAHEPGDLPMGYYTLQLSDGERQESGCLVVAPERCFEAETLLSETASASKVSTPARRSDKFWGVSCQLYTLRSQRSWGVGDFADLKELIEAAAAQGADLIGLNPLHAPRTDSQDCASPYSPSDRRFLNPIYIAPDLLPEFSQSGAIAELLASPDFGQQLQSLRAAEWVDYEAVQPLKYRLYELLYRQFLANQQAGVCDRSRAFSDYVAHEGEPLQQLAEYECHHNIHARSYRSETGFYCFLQWVAQQQLEDCQQRAGQVGMRVGIMGDLAVGAIPGGCEVSQNSHLYVPEVFVGAPPDPFSDDGQNWGLPVLNPVALRESHYRHLINLLRENMEHVGALRMDHAMSLMRLWWCLPRTDPEEKAHGLYVYYRIEDILPILALESQRNRCLVIGEDLGVVPDEFRQAMGETGVYGNDIFYFTQHWDGRFRAPHELRPNALLSITNHDVPTLSDWWSEDDIGRRLDVGVIVDEAAAQPVREQRRRDKRCLLQWLQDNRELPSDWQLEDLDKPFDFNLCRQIHRLTARSASKFVLLQLEDLQMMKLPVNIPATSREYPNWRRKQAANTDEIFARPEVIQLLAQIHQERQRSADTQHEDSMT
ncbi:4-alpha-glucanotransferase [Pseudomaricurvus hydrocarbonicus]